MADASAQLARLETKLEAMEKRNDERHVELKIEISDTRKMVQNGLSTRMSEAEFTIRSLQDDNNRKRTFAMTIQTAVMGLIAAGCATLVVYILQSYFNQANTSRDDIKHKAEQIQKALQ